MTGLFSLTSLLDEVAAKVIARGIIMQWCIMGNYAAIMSHLTTSSIYETLAWVALLWKLLSCRRSSLLTFTRNATQLALCDKISDDFTTSSMWFSMNSQALITQPFLTAIAVAIAVLQVTPVGLGKCCLTGQIVGWSNRLSTLLAR